MTRINFERMYKKNNLRFFDWYSKGLFNKEMIFIPIIWYKRIIIISFWDSNHYKNKVGQ